jgi:hypothetical protein
MRFLLFISMLAITNFSVAAELKLDPASLQLAIGEGQRLETAGAAAGVVRWESSEPNVVIAFQNGIVVGLRPGSAIVRAMDAGGNKGDCEVKVVANEQKTVPIASIKQFPDNREFVAKDRKCIGSELNGKVLGKRRPNRVENPKPLFKDDRLEWEAIGGSPVVDGGGVIIGTLSDVRNTDDGRRVHQAKFNYGMTKVIAGKLFVYAFSIRVRPDPARTADIEPGAVKNGSLGTSAWLAIDSVVEKETLLEHIGIGEGKLPRIPLGNTKFLITGGNPKQYFTGSGEELTITDEKDSAAHPSDYLRRPSGTVNILYSVPGFSLGGQGLDSFLISSGAIFRPVRGAKQFTVPTFRKGKPTEKTMTFVYGAVDTPKSETVYGWIAQEALGPVIAR